MYMLKIPNCYFLLMFQVTNVFSKILKAMLIFKFLVTPTVLHHCSFCCLYSNCAPQISCYSAL